MNCEFTAEFTANYDRGLRTGDWIKRRPRRSPPACKPQPLKIALEPLLHPRHDLPERRALQRLDSALGLRLSFEQQPDRRGITRVSHHIRQPARVAWCAQAYRHMEDLLAQLDHAPP